ncbi:Glycosyl transferase family 2 [Nitrosomonas eutropha]|uniref:glycosyltransferase n=1 Tax=Nitrosomonas eutropha TaxID=916 RepID=UPI000896791A|nr:glycosyltransferase [Nitrosomonas eutropha]SDW10075.1 Glycosyl transferase family 2 [Nitrosomonas eutropha]
MLSEPLVTVLIPSYNHGRYLRERIASIYAQTHRNFELIVIDDCSQDDSADIIGKLQALHGFKYIGNNHNSGTPFAAWERICDLAQGKYIWVCESDDVAEPTFLEIAIRRLEGSPQAVLFYTNSLVINEASEVIGHTESYFRDVWRDSRWEQEFSANGPEELVRFQLRGQTVPNMSSALIRAVAFRQAFIPFLKRFRLTGDWLFIGNVLRYGNVEFSPTPLNRFRKHEVTSRVRVKSARSQAEFILTKYYLFRGTKLPVIEFAPLMGADVIRFLYEPATCWDVVKSLAGISWLDTVRCSLLLLVSTIKYPAYLGKFKERYKQAKARRKENVETY